MTFEEVDGVPASNAKSLFGVVTGDYNVSDAIKELGGSSEIIPDYALTFFDKPREKLLTQVSIDVAAPKSKTASMWSAQGLQYAARNMSSHEKVEVLDVAIDPHPIAPKSKFQYFAIQGIPFSRFTSFIATYRQHSDEACVVVLDKHEFSIDCSFISWKRAQSNADLNPLTTVAKISFKGAVSDSRCSKLHQELLLHCFELGLKPRSEVEYRIIMSTAPFVISPWRKNSLLVELISA